MSVQIHPTAEVSDAACLGEGTRVWHQAQVREGAIIGRGCTIGKDVYIDAHVIVGDHCKLQNGVYLYRGVVLEDGVFMGPRATTTNDLHPRAIRSDGTPKGPEDWVVTPTRICRGAAIGAGAVLVCGVVVGAFAMVGAGAVVTRDVPPHGLALGNPARLRGAVCACGARLRQPIPGTAQVLCEACGERLSLESSLAALLRGDVPAA